MTINTLNYYLSEAENKAKEAEDRAEKISKVFVVSKDSKIKEFCEQNNILCVKENDDRIPDLMNENRIAICDFNHSIEPLEQTIFIGPTKENWYGEDYTYVTSTEKLAHVLGIELSEEQKKDQEYFKFVENFKGTFIERDIKKDNPDYENLSKEKQMELFKSHEQAITQKHIDQEMEKLKEPSVAISSVEKWIEDREKRLAQHENREVNGKEWER